MRLLQVPVRGIGNATQSRGLGVFEDLLKAGDLRACSLMKTKRERHAAISCIHGGQIVVVLRRGVATVGPESTRVVGPAA